MFAKKKVAPKVEPQEDKKQAAQLPTVPLATSSAPSQPLPSSSVAPASSSAPVAKPVANRTSVSSASPQSYIPQSYASQPLPPQSYAQSNASQEPTAASITPGYHAKSERGYMADTQQVMPSRRAALSRPDTLRSKAEAVPRAQKETYYSDDELEEAKAPQKKQTQFSAPVATKRPTMTKLAYTGGSEEEARGPEASGWASRLRSSSPGRRARESEQQQQQPQQRMSGGRFRTLYDQELGSGGFGVVYKAFDNQTGEFVAVKETLVGKESADATRQALQREFDMLQTLVHPHIVKVLHFACEEGKSKIYMEWLASGSVGHILRSTGFRFHERVIRRYAAEALRGLAYLHQSNVLHRDVKPGNMLVTASGTVKLSDFGTSKQVTQMTAQTTQQVVGTPCYMSRESISMGHYSAGSDIWAVGCSIVEMATGRPPWSHLPIERQAPIPMMFYIGTAMPPEHYPRIPQHLSEELRNLLCQMFAFDATQRPSAKDLLSHPYFADITRPLPATAEDVSAFEAAMREDQSKRQMSTDMATLSVSSGWLLTGTTEGDAVQTTEQKSTSSW